MNRYGAIKRSIKIAVTSERGMSVQTLEAIAGVLRRCRIAYVVCLDVDPGYVCVCRDGSVLGYGEPGLLRRFGFRDGM